MVASSRTLDALRTIGLNKYERNLWVALLSRGASTAGELSDISNVPRSRCYDVLESLASRGFVLIQPGKPLKYVAIQPKEAMERAKKKIQENAMETSQKIDRLVKSDAIKELEKLHKDNIKTIKPENLTGALKGRYAVLQQTETMLKGAKKTIKLVTTGNSLAELSENYGDLMKKIAESGVKIQIATSVTKQTNDVVKAMKKYAQVKNTAEAEKLDKLVGRLFVVDGEKFLLGLTDDAKTHPTQDVAFWTFSSHATSNVLEPVFDLIWHHAKPVK